MNILKKVEMEMNKWKLITKEVDNRKDRIVN